MQKEHWAYIKSLKVVPRLVHVAKYYYLEDILDKEGNVIGEKQKESKGITFNTGKNSAKRETKRRRKFYAETGWPLPLWEHPNEIEVFPELDDAENPTEL
jgi:hypothetical protein